MSEEKPNPDGKPKKRLWGKSRKAAKGDAPNVPVEGMQPSILSRLSKKATARDPWTAPPTFGQKWHHLQRREQLAYFVYAPFFFPLVLVVSLIMFPLWLPPISSLKPTLVFLGHGGNYPQGEKAVYAPRDAVKSRKTGTGAGVRARNARWKLARDIFAPIGWGGPVRDVSRNGGATGQIRFFKPNTPRGGEEMRGRWRGFWMRVWDMYTLERDVVHMFTKQGLQLVGVVCGLTLLAMQVTMMATELSGGQLERYTEAATSGGNVDFLTGDGTCGYVMGTGIANWSSGWQPFIWYAAYHSALGLMCILLIVEEILNAPMGLLAPTHSRAGAGYTLMFLAVSTMNTSPNWGWKRMIPIHQTLLTVIIFIGFYNVMRVFLAHFDCTASNQFGLMNLREHRTALRPWTEDEWQRALQWMLKGEHLSQDDIDDLHILQEISFRVRETSKRMDARFEPAELFHESVVELTRRSSDDKGEHIYGKPPNVSVDKLVQRYKKYGYSPEKRQEAMVTYEDLACRPDLRYTSWDHQYEHLIVSIAKFEADEEDLQNLWRDSTRRYLYGFPVVYMRPNCEEYNLVAQPKLTFYYSDNYYQDRFLIYTGDHPVVVPVARKYRLCYKGDIIPQLDAEWGACWKEFEDNRVKGKHVEVGGNKHMLTSWGTGTFRFGQERKQTCKWETEAEFNCRSGRNCKNDGAEYEGIHSWYPPDLYLKLNLSDTRRSNKKVYIWLDIRRMYAILVGLAMLLVHITLTWYNLGTGTNNWPAYRAQHEEAAKTWTSNGGLPNDACQYFKDSNLPIWIRPGEGSIKGVFSIISTYALWEFFLIDMSIAVILVSLSNSKIWGMSFPIPFTLVGPRLSSISVGFTMGLLGVSTLQLSLFKSSPVLGGIAKGTGYMAVAGFVLYLAPNEPMLTEVARRPFWIFDFLSRWAIEYVQHRREKAIRKTANRAKRMQGRQVRKERRAAKKNSDRLV